EEFRKHNCGAVVIGNFNTYRRFAWNAVNAYRFRLQRKAEVVAEAGDPGVFDTGLGLEFECRYNRSRMNLLNRAHRFEFASFLFEQTRPFPKFVLVHGNGCGREVEQGCRRKFRTGGGDLADFGLGIGAEPSPGVTAVLSRPAFPEG